MTKREIMNAIIAGEINETVIAWAESQLEKMDLQNKARKEKVSKTAQLNIPLVNRIVDEILGEEPVTATEVSTYMGIKPQKASALLRQAVKQGQACVIDVKIKGKGKQKGYTLAVEQDTQE